LRADRPCRKSRDIEGFLAANLHRPLDLQTIANALAMSPSSLQRACRTGFGTSVFDLLRKLRLDTARRHLISEQVSVAEAAYMAGYSNPANFATAFKRAYGVSPSRARQAG
jgi:AraC-like DNA-binding protein